MFVASWSDCQATIIQLRACYREPYAQNIRIVRICSNYAKFLVPVDLRGKSGVGALQPVRDQQDDQEARDIRRSLTVDHELCRAGRKQ